ncbi:helix-turn-helix transcriptional regulator [Streptomyces olivoreticuli]|uniref:helix-turn-helix domain-containing protein n=1 Tax=Streptomyces olivoreticuli TaxID=68246 RepID=UPI000E276747|nr:helix-turn-helix transcriptional regulator [Streptomyces olivoreticuli]
MPSPFSSAQAARKAIAGRLSDIKKDAGLTGQELAERCGWHPAKSSRIANGKTLPSDADIRLWCVACGAEDQIDDLIAASRTAESMYTEWKRVHRTGMRKSQEDVLPLYERTRVCRVYASNVVAGFFQTESYARALMASVTEFQGTPDDVDAAVASRLARSRLLHEGDHRFSVLLEEWVLRARIGDAATMAGQLGHLLTVMPLPSVSLGIIPFTAERRVWPLEAFYMFDGALVSVETLSAFVNITSPGEIAVYGKAFARLQKTAVYGTQARACVTRAIDALG